MADDKTPAQRRAHRQVVADSGGLLGAAEPTIDTSSATVDGYGNYYCPGCKSWMPLEGNWGAVALQEHIGELHA